MSVATELQRIIDAKADLKTAIEAKGVTVSSSALIDDYADYVDSIPSGGGAVQEKLLNFIDFDGTIVASYDGSEIAGLTDLPSAPDHSTDEVPLTAEEWNWTLAEIQSYHTNNPEAKIWVGMTYHPTDGKTHLFYNVIDDNRNPVQIYLNQVGSGETVDWGDGSAVQTFSSSTIEHTYATKGLFHCVISHTNSTEIRIGGGHLSSDFNLKNYSKLYRAFISDSITTFGNGSIYNCSSLQSITIPKTVASVGTNLFGKCYSLQSVVIPRTITSIGEYAFTFCYSLELISLPNSLSNGSYLFNRCYSLRSITIPNNFTISSATFYSCYSLQSVVIPSGPTSIGANAFQDCQAFQAVILPSTLTSIEANSAFSSCFSLQSITIPSTVTNIGSYAFNNTYSLYSITVLATTPPTLASGAISGGYQQKIYVPYSADHSILDAYKAATNWSNLASKMEELPE